MKVKFTISTKHLGNKNDFSVTTDVENIEELKTMFLIYFGRVDDVSKKLLKQKPLVEEFTTNAKSIDEWLENVNSETDWSLSIVFLYSDGFKWLNRNL